MPVNPSTRRRDRAFTLIEVMVVVLTVLAFDRRTGELESLAD